MPKAVTLPSVSRNCNNERPTMPNGSKSRRRDERERRIRETLDGDEENCNGFAGRKEKNKKSENKESFFGFLLDFVVETGIGWG